MMSWADLELDGWGATGPEALSTGAHPPALVAPQQNRRARVCKVCGRPWVDGECSFMPEQHARWGPAWER